MVVLRFGYTAWLTVCTNALALTIMCRQYMMTVPIIQPHGTTLERYYLSSLFSHYFTGSFRLIHLRGPSHQHGTMPEVM
jgi:hypothetical protein